MKLKEITSKIKYNNKSCHITLNNKLIGEWNDDALIDYPEDLLWSRDIGNLFREAFEAGYNYAKEEDKKRKE